MLLLARSWLRTDPPRPQVPLWNSENKSQECAVSRSEQRGANSTGITESYSSDEQALPAHGHARTRGHVHTQPSTQFTRGTQACEARRLTRVLNRAGDLQVSPFSTWKRKHREHVTSAAIAVHTLKQPWAHPRLPSLPASAFLCEGFPTPRAPESLQAPSDDPGFRVQPTPEEPRAVLPCSPILGPWGCGTVTLTQTPPWDPAPRALHGHP